MYCKGMVKRNRSFDHGLRFSAPATGSTDFWGRGGSTGGTFEGVVGWERS